MSGHELALSASFTLIVPVPRQALGPAAAADALALGALRLTRKVEHHVTAFGYGIGKPLKKALAADPSLRPALDAVIATWDPTIRVGDAFFHLQRERDEDVLDTVIVRVEADLAGLFRAARDLIAARPGSPPALLELLASAPPPHVTLYTSDPAGVAGIGLGSEDDLTAALARSVEGGTGLRAFPVPPSVVLANR